MILHNVLKVNKKMIDKRLKENYNVLNEKKGRRLDMENKKEVKEKLTDDPLENIRIMAPLLGKKEQENVFVYVMGLYNGITSGLDIKEGR